MKNISENGLEQIQEERTVYVNGKKAKLHGFIIRPISGRHIAETFGRVEYMDGSIDMIHSKGIKFNP